MGVAALGMLMGGMQEANKDDYNQGALLRQVMGTTQQGQQQANSAANSSVGSVIQSLIGGSSQAAQSQTQAGNAPPQQPQQMGLGGMLAGLLQPTNKANGADNLTDDQRYRQYNQAQFSPYTTSGSSGSSTAGYSY